MVCDRCRRRGADQGRRGPEGTGSGRRHGAGGDGGAGTTVGTNPRPEAGGAVGAVTSGGGFGTAGERTSRPARGPWGLVGSFEPVGHRATCGLWRLVGGTLADGTVAPAGRRANMAAAAPLPRSGARSRVSIGVRQRLATRPDSGGGGGGRAMWPNAYEWRRRRRSCRRSGVRAGVDDQREPICSGAVPYLQRLEGGLGAFWFSGETLIVQRTAAGAVSVETARARPIATALSGAAAGVIARARTSRRGAARSRNVIT